MNDEEQRNRMKYMLDQQDKAYKRGASGYWFQRWIPGVCKHKHVRCTHGDEIIGRNFRRRVCMVCGRSLKGPLPSMCYFTGGFHHVVKEQDGAPTSLQ